MNTLPATITAVTTSQHLSSIRVAVGEDLFHLLLAEASDKEALLHTHVTLAFKETEVILAAAMGFSTANIHRAYVEEIQSGAVLTQVTLSYREFTIGALVPTPTFEILTIQPGDPISWMVQPSEISLLRGA